MLHSLENALPRVGESFCGFELTEKLGDGAFSSVFLARQSGLAERFVALKISDRFEQESQMLAQLQHTNIVPIYSVHRTDDLHALCMPYLGRTTLDDVLGDLLLRQQLPQTGLELVDTIQMRHSRTKTALLSDLDEEGPPVANDEPAEGLKASSLQTLKGLSYVNAILWLFARLARGLEHAHERGILHRDIKPANVLLRDDGEPMLLDFNISLDTKSVSAATDAALGGTLPYMAPEHLMAFLFDFEDMDARTDVYSLGVLLFELLTGCRPFSSVVVLAGDPDGLKQMLEDRQNGPPPLRPRNPSVTPAVEAIVQRCLAPEPSARYSSASELAEDLENHLANLPLRHAPNPSRVEQVRKWSARHPRLSSTSSVALIATTIIVSLSFALGLASREIAEARAARAFEQFQRQLSDVQYHLDLGDPSDSHLAAGLQSANLCLHDYGVLQNPYWKTNAVIKHLPAAEQSRLLDDMGEVLITAAWAKMLIAASDGADGQAALGEALRFNQKAEECFATPPRTLWQQRAEILSRQGDQTGAERCLSLIVDIPLRSARDHFLYARDLFVHERYAAAAAALQKAIADDRQNLRYWFLLGRCHDSLGEDKRAELCYTVCTTLKPEYVNGYLNLGLACQRQRDYAGAIAAFDRAIELRPDLSDAYVNRALAKQEQKDYDGAIADLTMALAGGAPQTRVYFIRSRARARAGDLVGAEADRCEGLKRAPTDEASWIARGVARTEKEPQGAIADYDQALRLNGRSRAALQNKAHVLSERLGDPEAAVAVLDRLLEMYPASARALGGRGVLLARLGRFDAARDDARRCLDLDRSEAMLYQVACIYSLCSQADPNDRVRSLELLTSALRLGFGRTLIEADPDLHPLRRDAEFQRLVGLARSKTPSPEKS